MTTAEEYAAPSYHNLYVTTANLPRTSIFNLPYGYEVSCNRVGGWCVWLNGEQVAGEYGAGLRLDVGGYVICDSLTHPISPEPGDPMPNDENEAVPEVLTDLYICPSSGETESLNYGGFDKCCEHPRCPGNLAVGKRPNRVFRPTRRGESDG